MAEPDGGDRLFRKQALERPFSSEELGSVIQISPPWTWTVFGVLALMVLVAFVLSIVGRVEITGRGRGGLRPVGGVRPLQAQVAGVVAEVFAASGALVQEGSPILKLDSAPTQAALKEADGQLQLLSSSTYRTFGDAEDRLYELRLASLKNRIAVAREQSRSLNASLQFQERRLKAQLNLVESGLVSELSVDDVRDARGQLERQLAGNQATLLQLDDERTEAELQHRGQIWRRQQELHAAEARRESLAFPIQQSQILAPVTGYVESILVRRGDVVQPGQQIGKLVPKDAPMQVVVFLPERHRGFVRAGDSARLELDQFPYAEFGTLAARVLRIADDLAASYEVREVLGDDVRLESAVYRVELGFQAPRSGLETRPGMLLDARFTLRRQRPITIVFEPLGRWLR